MSDVNLLKTRSQCVAAKSALLAEVDGYQNRDQNLDYQDRVADRSETSVAARLATATSQLAYATQELARPDLSDADRKRYKAQEMTTRHLKERLENRAEEEGGTNAFLADVDADQVDAQVAVLTTAIAAVQAHHDGLPA
ncbi:hypothetical protein [Hymenobacter terrenus]|uniref:hypothetical protein n=1 Tax=Hymenobacter terrenus TaxID=1629124 RepID=UPI0006193153|nr:hypothetical protein [Hymenobacter terrenus]